MKPVITLTITISEEHPAYSLVERQENRSGLVRTTLSDLVTANPKGVERYMTMPQLERLAKFYGFRHEETYNKTMAKQVNALYEDERMRKKLAVMLQYVCYFREHSLIFYKQGYPTKLMPLVVSKQAEKMVDTNQKDLVKEFQRGMLQLRDLFQPNVSAAVLKNLEEEMRSLNKAERLFIDLVVTWYYATNTKGVPVGFSAEDVVKYLLGFMEFYFTTSNASYDCPQTTLVADMRGEIYKEAFCKKEPSSGPAVKQGAVE